MVCPHCELRIPDGSEKCEYCGLAIQVEEEPKPVKEKKPSVWLGTLGALAGALIGSLLLYFACSVAGLFGTVAGMGLAFCVLKGYQLLGRKLARGGIMISMAFVAVSAYFVDRIDWAYRVLAWNAQQVIEEGAAQIDIFGAFTMVPALLNNGNIDLTKYLTNLGMIYVFCAVGAYFTLKDILKNQD